MVMADSSALRFLVRKRTTFTWVVPVALLVATYCWGRWSPVAYAVGFAMLILGEIVRFWAAGYIHKDDVVATGGPYGVVRNPLYFGSLLLAAGFALMSGIGIVAWVVVMGLFFLFHLAAIASEERFLKTKFGEPYEFYLRQVPRLIPVPRLHHRMGDQSGSGAGFSMRQAMYNREHTSAAITLTTAVLFLVLELIPHGRLGF
jgi:protein-S-isoprenylcysteine O-methyltransferase Ste14